MVHNPVFIDDEWRASDLLSHREELAERWLTGSGIEIGALHQPLKLKAGVAVRYVDYKTKAENRVRYPELADREIVETDIVDDGFVLHAITEHSLDFIVGNHALEHSPDPYGTLLRWKSRLKPGGLLYFALPIAERCYDRGRPLTTLDHLLEDHRMFSACDRNRVLERTAAHVKEFLQISDANIRRQNGMKNILTEQEVEESCDRLMSGLREATKPGGGRNGGLITMHVQYLNRIYDVHYHTFSPKSLHGFIGCFCTSEGCELLELKKSGGLECVVVLRS